MGKTTSTDAGEMFRIGRIGSKKQIVSSSSRSGSASALTGPGKPRSLFHTLRPSYLRACRAAVIRHKGIGATGRVLRKKARFPLEMPSKI